MASAPLLLLSLVLIIVGFACLIEEHGLAIECDGGNDDDEDEAWR